jgi:hypothetical protein
MADYPNTATVGAKYLKFIKHRKDYSEITIFSIYEDKGVDTNESASDAPQRYTLIYGGLTQTQAKVILDHYNANRLSTTFSFQEPRNDPWTGTTGSTITGVRYESPVEQPEHDHVAVQSLIVHLIKRPS